MTTPTEGPFRHARSLHVMWNRWKAVTTLFNSRADVYNYDSLHSNVDDNCTATAIVDLSRDRDNHRYDVFTHSDIIDIY